MSKCSKLFRVEWDDDDVPSNIATEENITNALHCRVSFWDRRITVTEVEEEPKIEGEHCICRECGVVITCQHIKKPTPKELPEKINVDLPYGSAESIARLEFRFNQLIDYLQERREK